MTDPSSSILVLGAGELGLAMLRALSQLSNKSKWKITVLLRPAAAASKDDPRVSDIQQLGIDILSGDLVNDSEIQLVGLFRPFHTIIGCTGYANGAVGLQMKIARSVLAAEVALYIPWQFGVDYDIVGRGSAQDLFDEQLDVRDLLRSSLLTQDKTKWIVVSTGMFTSFLFESWFGVVDLSPSPDSDGNVVPIVRALGSWENEVTVTTPDDIASITAAIVSEAQTDAGATLLNSVVYTAGDTISYRALAEVVASVTGKQVQTQEWSLSQLKAELEEDTSDTIKKYRMVFGEGRGVAWSKDKTFNYTKQMNVTDVEKWLRHRLL
jgi:hypothetical protein